MKIDQLKEYISKIVKLEVRNVIQVEVKKCLNEAFTYNQQQNNKSVDVSNSDDSELISKNIEIKNLTEQNKPTKKQVRYTKNSVLNQVLNETAETFKGIPQEGDVVGMTGGFNNNNSKEIINESFESKIPESASEPVKKVAAILDRDFRATMKAIDKKIANKKV